MSAEWGGRQGDRRTQDLWSKELLESKEGHRVYGGYQTGCVTYVGYLTLHRNLGNVQFDIGYLYHDAYCPV